MKPHFDRAEILRQHSEGLCDSIDFIPSETPDTLVVNRGILFLMAFWSGPSILGFKRLCEAFSRTALPPEFVFRVLDIDGASDNLLETLSKYPLQIGGNAEGYWFREGRIFAQTSVSTSTDVLILQLVEASAGS